MESNGYFSELIKQYSNNTLETKEEDTEQIVKKIKSGSIKETNSDKSKLVELERVETGRVKLSVYSRYFKTISLFWCLIVITDYALMQGTQVGSNLWLANWSNSNDNKEEDRTLFYLLIYGYYFIIFSLNK